MSCVTLMQHLILETTRPESSLNSFLHVTIQECTEMYKYCSNTKVIRFPSCKQTILAESLQPVRSDRSGECSSLCLHSCLQNMHTYNWVISGGWPTYVHMLTQCFHPLQQGETIYTVQLLINDYIYDGELTFMNFVTSYYTLIIPWCSRWRYIMTSLVKTRMMTSFQNWS